MPTSRPAARTTILVQGARVHNLQNITIEIPRDELIVVTGLSGSGKSSLAFDTIYAEGQRRYLDSLASYARRFVTQVAKPDVDFLYGLSPVISIEQKTVANNPRSTVGTMTDINSYLNLLFATSGSATCPRTGEPMPYKTSSQIVESILALPEGTVVELRAPVFKPYGEDFEYIVTELRKKGSRFLIVDGETLDLSQDHDLDLDAVTTMDVVVDRLTLAAGMEKQLKAAVAHTLLIGDRIANATVISGVTKAQQATFRKNFGSATHQLVYGDISPDFFMFNEPDSACETCGGLGTYKHAHPDLILRDPKRSIRGGCFAKEAFKYNPDSWDGRIMYSLAQHLGFDVDAPWLDLTPAHKQQILHGIEGRFPIILPPDAKNLEPKGMNRDMGFQGIVPRIERWYKRYRQRGESNSGMEAWLNKVTVEHTCPDCEGTRLRASRLCFTLSGRTIHDLGQLNFEELLPFLDTLSFSGRGADAGAQVLAEITARLDLLLGIGLDYLNFNRKAGTLSGGEAQRIRLSTQIGSGLMGMLYVLDEPSIGLHPRDNTKMIDTLRSLRDIGNTVIVVEHDEDTIRAADHVIEMGPGPGIHGGTVVAQGTIKDILACPESPTGQYLSGTEKIPLPAKRRTGNGKLLSVRGASENNLKALDVDIPLGTFICVTGASGSGKSTLVNEIIYKRLWKELIDSRTLTGAHTGFLGVEHFNKVANIDQSPIGRNSRSNPATYVGFYDNIRKLFAGTPLAKERGYKPGRFSFNVKGGRCEECQGEGNIRTQLYFMPDVEAICPACKGARYNPETLEVTWQDKTIADILDMSIEEGTAFFAKVSSIHRPLSVLNDLGLGYLTLGQGATTLSGGEAQRVKLASELSRLQRRQHILYILDEPTTGLHLADIRKLLECLQRLVIAGHTVLVIEHHLDVIKCADHIIDLGPDGGHGGGEIVAQGTPDDVANTPRSHTGHYLKPLLNP